MSDSNLSAPIDGAGITLEHLASGWRAEATSNDRGFYAAVLLPPGEYRVLVKAEGYQSQESYAVVLPVAGRIDFDVRLRPLDDVSDKGRYRRLTYPNRDERLTIVGPDFDTTLTLILDPARVGRGILQSTVSYLIDPQQIRELPFFGRDVYTMLVTAPGVSSDGATARGLGLAANGRRPSSSSFLLDGVENNNLLLSGPLSIAPPELMQEYRISVSSYSAEHGRTAGYVANAITASGGNQWRGLGFANLRNEALNANDFQNNLEGISREPLREIQAGLRAGGPLRPERLFLSSGLEIYRSRNRAAPVSIKVPSERFVESSTAPGSVARSLLDRFKPPGGGDNAFTANLDVRPPVSLDRVLSLGRLDAVSGPGRARWMLRGFYSRASRPDFAWYPYEEFSAGLSEPVLSFAAQHVWTPGAQWAVESRWGLGFMRSGWERPHLEIPTLGVSQTLVEVGDSPADTLRPTLLPGSPLFYSFRHESKSIEGNQSWTWIPGRHVLQFGGGFLGRRLDGHLTAGRDGLYLFDDLSAFGLDQPSFFSASLQRAALPEFLPPGFEASYKNQQYFVFLQDSYRAAPRLSLNWGLRYESFGTLTARGVDPLSIVKLGSGQSFIERLQSATLRASDNALLHPTDHVNFAPRLGFAYALGEQATTVVRGSYGVFFDRPFDNLWLNARNNNFVVGTFEYAGAGGNSYLAPVESLLAGYAGQPFGMDFPSLSLIDTNLRSAYAQSYFLGVNRELATRWSLEAAFLGSLGRKLTTTDIVNRPFSLELSDGNPQGRANPDLPDIEHRASQGRSEYRALTVRLQHFGRAATLHAAYTWSRFRDHQSDALAGHFFDLNFTRVFAGPVSAAELAAFSRQFDLNADWGMSDFDQRHSFVAYSIWNLPSARLGHRLSSWLRGWRISQMAAVRSGLPYSVRAPSQSLPGGGQIFNPRADIADRSRLTRSAAVPGGKQLLNPVAGEGFTFPAPGETGNSGRNAFRAPTFFNIDVSLARRFRPGALGEQGALTLRFDVFNVLNHANLSEPETLLGSPGFGQARFGRVGRASGFPILFPLRESARQIQILLRIEM